MRKKKLKILPLAPERIPSAHAVSSSTWYIVRTSPEVSAEAWSIMQGKQGKTLPCIIYSSRCVYFESFTLQRLIVKEWLDRHALLNECFGSLNPVNKARDLRGVLELLFQQRWSIFVFVLVVIASASIWLPSVLLVWISMFNQQLRFQYLIISLSPFTALLLKWNAWRGDGVWLYLNCAL